MTRPLHIPYKFAQQTRNFHGRLRSAILRNTNGQSVNATELERVIEDAFEGIGQDNRQAWLEIERWAASLNLVGAASTFNATIDSAQTVADPTNHIYPNLASLVANESWSNTFVFHAYMVNRPDSPVIETGAITLPGPIVIEGPGVGTQADSNYFTLSSTVGGRALWDIQGATITNSVGMCHIKNITMFRSTAGTQTQIFSDHLVMENSFFNGLFSGATKIAKPNGGVHWGINSAYSGVPQFASNTFLQDCHLGVSAGSNFTLCSSDLVWLGGTIELVNAGAAFTMTIGGNAVIRWTRDHLNTVFSSTVSGDIPIALTTAKSVSIENFQKTGNSIALTVPAGMSQLYLRGFWGNTTIGAAASTSAAVDVDITCQGTADFTGPGNFKVALHGNNAAIMRGNGILGEVTGDYRAIINLAGTKLQLIGCINSNIRACLVATGATIGGQAYTIDAASGPGILTQSGAATFPVASVNNSLVGAKFQVLDETGVHWP